MFRPLVLPLFTCLALTLAAAPDLARSQGRGPAGPGAAQCLRETRQDTLLGGLIGGGLGAIVGNLASHGGTGATVGGAIGGAAGGALIGHATARCGQNRYGYYDEAGRWVSYRATAYGYYDPDGRWVPQPPQAWPTPVSAAEAATPDTQGREQALAGLLQRRMDEGTLTERDGRRALRELDQISAMDQAYRGEDGRLSPDQRADVDRRLDDLVRRAGPSRP